MDLDGQKKHAQRVRTPEQAQPPPSLAWDKTSHTHQCESRELLAALITNSGRSNDVPHISITPPPPGKNSGDVYSLTITIKHHPFTLYRSFHQFIELDTVLRLHRFKGLPELRRDGLRRYMAAVLAEVVNDPVRAMKWAALVGFLRMGDRDMGKRAGYSRLTRALLRQDSAEGVEWSAHAGENDGQWKKKEPLPRHHQHHHQEHQNLDRLEQEKSSRPYLKYACHQQHRGRSACEGASVPAPPPRLPPQSPPLVAQMPQVTLDDFTIQKVLGKGCMGKVFLVRSKTTSRPYALKSISKSWVLSHRELKHALTERQVLSAISSARHPFLIQCHYAFTSRAELFLVLDFVGGGDMATQLARFGRFGEERTKFYAAEIVMGIMELHRLGIVYRDMKPENVLLKPSGHIVLTDFGLSKRFETHEEDDDAEESTRTGTFCGTAEYLAPEILRNEEYSFEVDWWSLGTCIYEMLAGVTPFWAESNATMYRRVLQDPLECPRSFHVSTILLLRGLLDRDPSLRTTDATIKQQPYFRHLDWDMVYHQKYSPPYVPSVQDPLDVSHFEACFLNMTPQLSPAQLSVPKTCQDFFYGYSWRRPVDRTVGRHHYQEVSGDDFEGFDQGHEDGEPEESLEEGGGLDLGRSCSPVSPAEGCQDDGEGGCGVCLEPPPRQGASCKPRSPSLSAEAAVGVLLESKREDSKLDPSPPLPPPSPSPAPCCSGRPPMSLSASSYLGTKGKSCCVASSATTTTKVTTAHTTCTLLRHRPVAILGKDVTSGGVTNPTRMTESSSQRKQ